MTSPWKLKVAVALFAATGLFGAGLAWLGGAPASPDPLGPAPTHAAEREKPAPKRGPGRDTRDAVRDALAEQERAWELADEKLSQQIIEVKTELATLEDQLRVASLDRSLAELDAAQARVREHEELQQLKARIRDGGLGKKEATARGLEEALRRLSQAQTNLKDLHDVRRRLRKQVLTLEEDLRRLEQKRADRRAALLRQREEAAERLRQLEAGDTGAADARAIERGLGAVLRELDEVRREVRALREAARKR